MLKFGTNLAIMIDVEYRAFFRYAALQSSAIGKNTLRIKFSRRLPLDNNNRSTVSQTRSRNRKGVLGIDFRSPSAFSSVRWRCSFLRSFPCYRSFFSLKGIMNAPYAPTEKNNWLKLPLRRTEPRSFPGKAAARHTNILRTTVLFLASQFPVFPVGGMDSINTQCNA